jgi:hypothetical protein
MEVNDECVQLAKDRWQVVIDALLVYYTKELEFQRKELRSIHNDIPDPEKVSRRFAKLVDIQQRNVDDAQRNLNRTSAHQRQLDNEDLDFLFDHKLWETKRDDLIHFMESMNIRGY